MLPALAFAAGLGCGCFLSMVMEMNYIDHQLQEDILGTILLFLLMDGILLSIVNECVSEGVLFYSHCSSSDLFTESCHVPAASPNVDTTWIILGMYMFLLQCACLL